MFGLLGLLGAVMAGFMVDALVAPGHDHHADDAHHPPGDPPDTTDGGTSSLLDDPGAQNDPDAGMPTSDDLHDPKDADESLAGGEGNDVLAGQGGDDSVTGGAGNDQLGGRDGADDLKGGG